VVPVVLGCAWLFYERQYEEALALYRKRIPFKWGGKSPEQGFDSSGFIAYLLKQVGIISDPQQYWSVNLLTATRPISVDQAEPGDVIYYEYGICMLVLDHDTRIGALPGGVATGNLDGVIKTVGVGRF